MSRTDLVSLIRPELRRVYGSLAIAVLQGLMLYPALWLVRELFDSVIPAGEPTWALLACVGILCLRLAGAEVALLQRTLAMKAAKGAAAHRRRQLVRWLLETEVSRLEDDDPGRLQSRLISETERLDVMLNRALSVASPAAVAGILAILAMGLLDWRLAAVTLALGIPASWLAARGGATTTTTTVRFQDAYEHYSSSIRFAVRHLLLIRSRGHVDLEEARQEATINNLRDAGIHMAVSYARQARLQTISATTVAVAVLALGSLLVIQGELTLGGLAAFYVSALVCASAVTSIGAAIPELKSGVVAADRLADLVGAGTIATRGAGRSPVAILPMRLRSVDFSYGDRSVLRGVDLDLAAGRHVDLNGPNGAGKSTLMRLLLGLEVPAAGSITVGGVSLQDLDTELIRRRIGFAPQTPTFFSGSVLENLLYGRPHATRSDAEHWVEVVGAADAVSRLDGGLDALMGEDGVRLSGGEGQRLAIARALVGDPELVVLDEPGNHLPQSAVADIVGRLRHARPEVALLTIGHGHLALGIADVSLRLHAGRLHLVTADD